MDHRRLRDHLVQQPGTLLGPRPHVENPGTASVQGEGHTNGDRRRVRREGSGRRLPGAAGRQAVPDLRPAREDRHEPYRGVRRHRADVWNAHLRQDGSDQRRAHHRRRGPPDLRGGGLPRLACRWRLPHDVRPVRHTQRASRGRRRTGQQAEVRRLSRSRLARRGVRRRAGHRRPRPLPGHGPDRAAPAEHLERGHAADRRAQVPAHRQPGDSGGSPRAPTSQQLGRRRTARTRSCRRCLVQRKRTRPPRSRPSTRTAPSA